MRLCDCADGARARVLRVAVPAGALLRAREIGLRDGVVLRVLQHGPFGGLVLAVGGARVAVDSATARRVQVEPIGLPA